MTTAGGASAPRPHSGRLTERRPGGNGAVTIARPMNPREGREMKSKELQEAILGLPADERAELAHRLLLSLDDPSEEELSRMWLSEAARRGRALDRGDARPVPAEEVQEKARALLR